MHSDFDAIVLFSSVDFVIMRIDIDDLESNNTIFILVQTIVQESVCITYDDTIRNTNAYGPRELKKKPRILRWCCLRISKDQKT